MIENIEHLVSSRMIDRKRRKDRPRVKGDGRNRANVIGLSVEDNERTGVCAGHQA